MATHLLLLFIKTVPIILSYLLICYLGSLLGGIYFSCTEPFASMSPVELAAVSKPAEGALYCLCLSIWTPTASWYWSRVLKPKHPNDIGTPTASRYWSRVLKPKHPNDIDDKAKDIDDDNETATSSISPADSTSQAGRFLAPRMASAGNQPRSSHGPSPRVYAVALLSPPMMTGAAVNLRLALRNGTIAESPSMSEPDIREVLEDWAEMGYIENEWRKHVRFDLMAEPMKPGLKRQWRRNEDLCRTKTQIARRRIRLYGISAYYHYDLLASWVGFNLHYDHEEMWPAGYTHPPFLSKDDYQSRRYFAEIADRPKYCYDSPIMLSKSFEAKGDQDGFLGLEETL